MRRRPQVRSEPLREPLEELGPQRPPIATQRGDVIEPFLVSGGAPAFFAIGEVFDPRPSGVQLVAAVWVPLGRIGFLKELRVAPFIPPELADPWVTSGARDDDGTTATASWREFDGSEVYRPRAPGTNGVWTAPFAWESYFDVDDEEAFPPQWVWSLRFCRGNVLRRPPIDFDDPTTWAYQLSVPVPALAYGAGLPGNAPPGYWPPQRMQVLQGDALHTHVVVPPDTTLCLFVQWRQEPFLPLANVMTAGGPEVRPYAAAVYPLLPSFGSLHGYLQAADNTDASTENALLGWGG